MDLHSCKSGHCWKKSMAEWLPWKTVSKKILWARFS